MFPTHPDGVTPEWLGACLCKMGLIEHVQPEKSQLVNVRWEPIGTGQVGDSVRFHLTYDRDGAGPPSVAGKFPAADATSRNTAVQFGLYAKEVRFYRELAGRLAMRAPKIVAAELDEGGGGAFVLIFEDLGPALQGDQIGGCTLAQARTAIGQAAAIHAPSWNDPDITGKDWLQPDDQIAAQVSLLYPQAQKLFQDRYADVLEPEYMAICAALADAAGHWFSPRKGDRCVIHGDFRLDNMLFDIHDGAEPIAVLDWQTAGVGHAMTDIGYFLGCGIGPELRAAHEDELFDLYVEEMNQRGVPLSRDLVWDDYRLGALHGVSTAVFSAAFVERTERGDANFLSMARGACALALAHDSIGALLKED